MSMQFFRDKKKSFLTALIFGAIILTFVVWGGYQDIQISPSALTEVNGEEIPYTDYQRVLGRQLEQYGQMFGGGKPLSNELAKMVERQVVQSLVMERLLAQRGRKMGIAVSDQSILEDLKETPAFKDPKLDRFSPSVYQAVLEANDLTPARYESLIRQDKLSSRTRDWLRRHDFTSEAAKADQELVDGYQFDLSVVSFDPEKIKTSGRINISEEELKKYHEGNRKLYLSKERKAATVYALDLTALKNTQPVTPKEVEDFYNAKVKASTDEEWNSVQARARHILISDSSERGLKRARDLMTQIKSEADFMRLAASNSEDFSNASQGGDLGYFGEKRMVPAFSDATFKKAKLNSVFGPVKTDFGYHLIWLKDRTTPANTLENRQKQIEYKIAQEKAASAVEKVKADIDAALASKKGKEIEAALSSFTKMDYNSFEIANRPADLPFLVAQKISTGSKDSWQGPDETDGKLFVAKVTKVEAPQELSFEDARSRVLADLERKKISELIVQTASEWKSPDTSAKAEKSLQALGGAVKTHRAFKPFTATSVPDAGESELLLKAVQGLSPAAPISESLQWEGRTFLFKGANFKTPERGTSTAQKDAAANATARARGNDKKASEDSGSSPAAEEDKLESQRQMAILDAYIKHLMKNAKMPTDFRKKYDL